MGIVKDIKWATNDTIKCIDDIEDVGSLLDDIESMLADAEPNISDILDKVNEAQKLIQE